MLDLDYVRPAFPALETPWALFDNAGGSACLGTVAERVADHLARRPVQLGATYPLSVEAGAAVVEGRRAAARLVAVEPEQVVFGASSTVLVQLLARALSAGWEPGDEIVVTDLDHESNIGPWRALEAEGLRLREWRLRPEGAGLALEDLEPLLNARTRVVAFTHVANVVGAVHDVPALCARIRAAGALSVVDGVAYAPHRRVDLEHLGADFYFLSFYKVFGPHLAALVGTREAWSRAASQNHDFVESTPARFEPGNPCYESVAALPAVVEYLEDLGRHQAQASTNDPLEDAFEHIGRHEAELSAPLLSFLAEHRRVRLLGPAEPDPERRVPTLCFQVEGTRSSAVVAALEKHCLALRHGHFYAARAIDALGLADTGGIVRASLVHYNEPREVERLLEGLDAALSR